MATYGLDDVAFILIDGYQLAGYIYEFSDEQEAVLEETHCCGDSWVERTYVGIKRAAFNLKGYFDDTDNATSEALVDSSASRLVAYSVQGNTVGNDCTMFSGSMQARVSRLPGPAELTKIDASYEGNGEVEEGQIVGTLTARTTAGNTDTASADNGAESTGGVVAHLHMSSLTLGGYDSVTVKLRHSADNVTFADVSSGAFTAVTAAPAKQRLAIAGTVNQYTSIAWTYAGSGTGQTFTAFVGLHRN